MVAPRTNPSELLLTRAAFLTHAYLMRAAHRADWQRERKSHLPACDLTLGPSARVARAAERTRRGVPPRSLAEAQASDLAACPPVTTTLSSVCTLGN